MKRFGLIGYPVAHSLSPALFRAGYSGRYSYDLIESENFTEAYGKFLDGYDGVNITAPFKEQALAKADILSPECRLIGATNLIVKSENGIKAYNSDYYGIALSIMAAVRHGRAGKKKEDAVPEEGTAPSYFPPRPSQQMMMQTMSGKARTALVVGAGGAGKAAAVAAASLGLKTTLMNRTAEKAEKIASELPELKLNIRGIDEFPEAFFDNDIIIYTLPTGIMLSTGIDAIRKIEDLLTQRSDAALPAGTARNNQDNQDGQNPDSRNNQNNQDQDGQDNQNNQDSKNGLFGDTGAGETEKTRTGGIQTKYVLEANYRAPAIKSISGILNMHGITYIPGEQWLLFQAYAGYDLFTGEVPSLSAMAAMLSER